MARFTDLISGFNNEELPDDWREKLTNAYNEDIDISTTAYNKLNSDFETYKTGSESEIQNLKAKNYELLMSQPDKQNTDNTVDDDTEEITVEDLFGQEKD